MFYIFPVQPHSAMTLFAADVSLTAPKKITNRLAPPQQLVLSLNFGSDLYFRFAVIDFLLRHLATCPKRVRRSAANAIYVLTYRTGASEKRIARPSVAARKCRLPEQ